MMWVNAGWWLIYTFMAVAMQAFLPGVDLLLPGLLLALSEKNIIQLLCIGTIFLLLQEGMGSMAFGGTLLLYTLAALFFFAGCSLFQGRSVFFVSLLGLLLSFTRYIVFAVLTSLQNIPWYPERLLEECLIQTILTPAIWWIAFSLRKGIPHEARI